MLKRRGTSNWTDDDELRLVTECPELRLNGWRHHSESTLVEPETTFDADLIPDIGPMREPDEIDNVLAPIDIVRAYELWGGKGFTPKIGSKRESVMIRCPFPDHPDKEPSAWMNLDKNLWHCGKCEFGGDKYEMGAVFFHEFNPHTFKQDGTFPELRRRMAESLGYRVSRTPGGQTVVMGGSEDESDDGKETGTGTQDPTSSASSSVVAPDPEPTPAPAPALAPVIDVTSSPEEEQFEDTLREKRVRIDWESITPDETFMAEWMTTTTVDDLPHEYYYFLGLMALAAAGGPSCYLEDYKAVKTNLFVCLYGRTGSGKSRALDPFIHLIKESLPFKDDPYHSSTGTKMVPSPGSAEALLRSYVHEIHDPSTNAVTDIAPVRGILRVEEFAAFVARASRATNPMKEMLIELYDAWQRDVTHYSISGGSITARNPFCQMVTTTQPDAIHNFLRRSDAASGFMNRWVFATGLRRRDRIAHGGISIDIQDAIRHLKSIHAWSATTRPMRLEGDALKAWEKFYHRFIGPMYDKLEESMFSRVDLILKKIIIIMTINEKKDHPTAEIVERATSLFDYLIATYGMFSKDLAHTDTEECQNRVLKVMHDWVTKTNQTSMTLREITKRVGSKYPRDLIERAIKTLEVLDMIEVDRSGGARGPATKRYKLNHA